MKEEVLHIDVGLRIVCHDRRLSQLHSVARPRLSAVPRRVLSDCTATSRRTSMNPSARLLNPWRSLPSLPPAGASAAPEGELVLPVSRRCEPRARAPSPGGPYTATPRLVGANPRGPDPRSAGRDVPGPAGRGADRRPPRDSMAARPGRQASRGGALPPRKIEPGSLSILDAQAKLRRFRQSCQVSCCTASKTVTPTDVHGRHMPRRLSRRQSRHASTAGIDAPAGLPAGCCATTCPEAPSTGPGRGAGRRRGAAASASEREPHA